jgi:hypothetical protein
MEGIAVHSRVYGEGGRIEVEVDTSQGAFFTFPSFRLANFVSADQPFFPAPALSSRPVVVIVSKQ